MTWCGQGTLCVPNDSREVPNRTETLLHPLSRRQLAKAVKTLSVPIPKPEGKDVRSPGLRAKAVCPSPTTLKPQEANLSVQDSSWHSGGSGLHDSPRTSLRPRQHCCVYYLPPPPLQELKGKIK